MLSGRIGRFPGVVWSPCSIRGRCRARRYCLAKRDSSIPVRSRSALMASPWNRPPPSAGGSHRSISDDLAELTAAVGDEPATPFATPFALECLELGGPGWTARPVDQAICGNVDTAEHRRDRPDHPLKVAARVRIPYGLPTRVHERATHEGGSFTSDLDADPLACGPNARVEFRGGAERLDVRPDVVAECGQVHNRRCDDSATSPLRDR